MHAAVAEQSEEMQRPAGALGVRAGLEECGLGEEAPVGDRFVDADQVLLDHTSGAKVEVPHLGVAHLPYGKSHGKTGRVEQGARRARPERIPRRHLRHRDGIALTRLPMTEAIDHYQHYRTDFRSGHLGFGADEVSFHVERRSECITSPKPE